MIVIYMEIQETGDFEITENIVVEKINATPDEKIALDKTVEALRKMAIENGSDLRQSEVI